MKYLLDTHAFLWAAGEPDKLSPKVKTLLLDRDNQLLLSLASVWEIQIKIQAGKLTLPSPLPSIIQTQQQINQLELLPIELSHILALGNLPDHHRDPFDRIMIAQAQVEDIILISRDPMVTQYSIQVIW